jgi:menaquinone reductase, multiheme cytochrome c subunit
MSDSHATTPAENSETAPQAGTRFVFPRVANYALPLIALSVVGGLFYLPTLFALGASPKSTAVGYAPVQPVAYSHALHAGQLGLDCRYCHTTVEKTAFAAVPPTQTCMNCHTTVGAKPDPKPDGTFDYGDAKYKRYLALKPVYDSWSSGLPIQWIKVHDLPDYAYFNHSAHVNHGVGCVECHGRIDQMEVVAQQKPLSMGWCLDCHRDPGTHLRPKDVAVTNMSWKPPTDPTEAAALGEKLKADYKIHDVAFMQSCYTCHR